MHVDDSWYRPKIDKKDIKELSRKSDWEGSKHFLIYFSALFIFGLFTIITWGTWSSLIFLFLYSTIWAYSPSNWHETLHRTAFKSKIANDFFYYISSFMANMEPSRWRSSHTFHHSHTLQTHDDYDHEIQLTRPTDLIYFFLQFIPLGQLIYPHKTLQAEIIRHAFCNLTGVNNERLSDVKKKEIINNSRLFLLVWISILAISLFYKTWIPIVLFLLPNYIGAPMNQIVNITQHLAVPFDLKDHRKMTHNIKINPILSFLYYHMEYHLEHHLFPTIPSHNLPKLHNLIKDQIPGPHPSLFSFWKSVLPSVIKQAYDPKHVYKIN
tara:strand:+ start:159 stop:1130 length:972 start_codon:yes stop_codon:yes gene_type:complete